MKTTTMTIEDAGYIIRRKPRTASEYKAVGDALYLLGQSGVSDHDATMQAQRDLTEVELSILCQGRVA